MPRIAVVSKDDCYPDKCGNYLCKKLCPVNRTGKDCIVQGDDGKAKIDEALCTGCGICPKRCPYEAINIINLPKELEKQPVHRYGPNGFILFSVPAPEKGKVIGIIGKNAIGKSTAIKILAGVLNPNLGGSDEVHIEELIDFFRGTQMQKYFEEVQDGSLRISFKPQQISMIPESCKGTVKSLLEQIPEPVEYDLTIDALALNNFLDYDISSLSGGELQRVAIAAAALKSADVYILDEPTSYLDIKQRIMLSSFLERLANRGSAVLVIEHDLIILDYLADAIQIMYGQEGAYGITSMSRAVKAGINVYLSGYMKEENMRFRDESIRFEASPAHKDKTRPELISWNALVKNVGDFKLKVDKGGLHKGLICGVLGENAIGKTTFVKMLAGEIKPDQGEISGNLKIAYKPQYLVSDSDELVMSVLGTLGKYKQILKGFNLDKVMLKKLRCLSGGELQKVALALCLSKEADLYLLDEPSAFLDVEQRLLLGKLLKDFAVNTGKTILVVDHDLLFLDEISDKMILFDGEPSKQGTATDSIDVEDAMNEFLSRLDITMRRDEETLRPRINKKDSRKDREQKNSEKRYYV